MPRPRAAECPPATQGRVCTTDAAAFGSKRALGAAVKNLQATSLSLDLVQRPRADGGVPGALGVLRDALSLGPLRLRFEFESWLSLGLGSRTALAALGARLGGLPRAP